ncbi:hypothetical protein GCM10020358_04030 [Amorphoplanes nipponensis]|uniref:DUF1707 SHOCT-like domain-containing protein n=1 Tax=Actinoplanes nipponensis TaxID=135950 RepID=UPI003374F3B1
MALVVGGATIAPALTVETNLVGRIAPAGMLNEAYTWVVTVSVAGSAGGGAVAGVIVDQPGGLPWAFVFAAVVLAVAASVAAVPAGPMARADHRAAELLCGRRWPRRTDAGPVRVWRAVHGSISLADMAKEVAPRTDAETLRAADADRHKIADQLKSALDEGRLTLHEYDDRVRQAYAARTYAELLILVADLPRP